MRAAPGDAGIETEHVRPPAPLLRGAAGRPGRGNALGPAVPEPPSTAPAPGGDARWENTRGRSGEKRSGALPAQPRAAPAEPERTKRGSEPSAPARPYLDGLVGVPPGHRAPHQLAVQILHGSAAAGARRLLAAGGGGGDAGALGQVEVGRVEAVPVHIAGEGGGRPGGGGGGGQSQQQQQRQEPSTAPLLLPLRRPRHLRSAGPGSAAAPAELPRLGSARLSSAPLGSAPLYFSPGCGEGPGSPAAPINPLRPRDPPPPNRPGPGSSPAPQSGVK